MLIMLKSTKFFLMKQTAALYTTRHYILQNLDGYMVIEVTYN